MSQLTSITASKGRLRYLRWPYQAMVMKMLEIVSRMMVSMALDCKRERSGRSWRAARDHHAGQQIEWITQRQHAQRPQAVFCIAGNGCRQKCHRAEQRDAGGPGISPGSVRPRCSRLAVAKHDHAQVGHGVIGDKVER